MSQGNRVTGRSPEGWTAIVVCFLCLSGLTGMAGCPSEGDPTACNSDCWAVVYTPCTCAPDDPCGWERDGFCDAYYCFNVTSSPFDDSFDCGGGGSIPCDMDCGLGRYTACTCGAGDPCGWIMDGYCDSNCDAVTASPFDDSADCGGGGDPCGGECAMGLISGCTCDGSNPCGWSGNGVCEQSSCEAQFGSGFNDAIDCGGGSTGQTFGVSAVRDDLDNADMDMMARGLQGLGYEMMVRDSNVSSRSLSAYFQQSLTTFYHTGHGFEEGIATSDGVLLVNQIHLNVENAIIATCLALAYGWDAAFGPSTQTVLGYTKVSFDWIDNQVVQQMVSSLGSGRSYLQAWFDSNAGIADLSDRWAAYVRESGAVVEYSARNGRQPAAPAEVEAAEGTLVPLGRAGRLWSSERLLDDPETFAAPHAALPIRTGEGDEVERELMPGGWARLTPTRLSRDGAEEIARSFVEARLGGMPHDARLERISSVIRRTEGGPEVTVGWVVRFGRLADGVQVRGNGVEDHLVLLLGSGGVVSWSRYWPEMSTESVPLGGTEALLTVGEAVSMAADQISRGAKGELILLSARSVWGTLGPGRGAPDLVPAYQLEAADGTTVVVDALTGRVLR